MALRTLATLLAPGTPRLHAMHYKAELVTGTQQVFIRPRGERSGAISSPCGNCSGPQRGDGPEGTGA
eukprot:7932542-Prorocentrum_lima.AAC.1